MINTSKYRGHPIWEALHESAQTGAPLTSADFKRHGLAGTGLNTHALRLASKVIAEKRQSGHNQDARASAAEASARYIESLSEDWEPSETREQVESPRDLAARVSRPGGGMLGQ